MSETEDRGPGLITWIIIALVVWGGILAVGSYLNSQTLLWQRAAIVFGMTAAFAGFWVLMLAVRKRRLAREAEEE